VWARLFILDKQFKAAEGLYLEQNNLEAGFPETFSVAKCFAKIYNTKWGCFVYVVQINTYSLAESRSLHQPEKNFVIFLLFSLTNFLEVLYGNVTPRSHVHLYT
jgi:hypothetical protein